MSRLKARRAIACQGWTRPVAVLKGHGKRQGVRWESISMTAMNSLSSRVVNVSDTWTAGLWRQELGGVERQCLRELPL